MKEEENNKKKLLFHTIENINLQLAVIDNLWRVDIIPDLKTDEICKKINFDINNANPENPIVEVEEYLYSMDIADEDLLKLTSFYWGKESLIHHVIWPSWKGDDNYFNIISFEGIEVLENLRSITGEYFACESAEPIPLLSYLEEININNSKPFRSLESFLDIMDLKVLHITAESDNENFKNAEELRKEVTDIKIVWQDVEPETKVGRIYDQIKYSKKSVEEQLELLNKAIEICPELSWLYQKRSEILFRNETNLKMALIDINKAIELNAEPISSYYTLRAEIYTEMNEYENAIFDYTIAIKHDNLSSLLAKERGKLYRILKDYNRAISDYSCYLEAKNRDDKKLLLESYDKKFYLELIEMYICTNNYNSGDLLIQNFPLLLKAYQLIFDLLQYIIDLSTGKKINFNPDFSKEKKAVRLFLSRWDYSHLELWISRNGFEGDTNKKIIELIGKFKQVPK